MLLLELLFVDAHLFVPNGHLRHLSLREGLHRLNHLLLFEDTSLLVKLSSLLILAFPQLAVLNDDLLALGCAPNFIVEFLLLVGLALHKINDEGFSLALFDLSQELGLL